MRKKKKKHLSRITKTAYRFPPPNITIYPSNTPDILHRVNNRILVSCSFRMNFFSAGSGFRLCVTSPGSIRVLVFTSDTRRRRYRRRANSVFTTGSPKRFRKEFVCLFLFGNAKFAVNAIPTQGVFIVSNNTIYVFASKSPVSAVPTTG